MSYILNLYKIRLRMYHVFLKDDKCNFFDIEDQKINKERNMEKNKLGTGGLIYTAIGSGLGVAIVSYIGVVIGMAGKGAFVTVILCAIMGFFIAMPYFLISKLIVFSGGSYGMIKKNFSKTFAAIDNYCMVLYTIAYATFPMAIVSYICSLIPALAPYTKVITIALAVIVCLMLCGDLKLYDKLQTFCTIALLVGLVVFIGFGLSALLKNGASVFTFDDPIFTQNGWSSVIKAVPVILGQTTGYVYVVYYGPLAKNPKKDIPKAVLFGGIVIVMMWLLLSLVAVNAVPIDQIANQPLTNVAKAIMPAPLPALFVILGPIMAIFTSYIGGIQTPVAVMSTSARDGWLPKLFGKTNKKGRYQNIYIFITVIVIVVVLFNLSVGDVIKNIALSGLVQALLIQAAFLGIPKRHPEYFKSEKSRKTYTVLLSASFTVVLINTIISVATVAPAIAVINLVGLVILYFFCRYWIKSGHARDEY